MTYSSAAQSFPTGSPMTYALHLAVSLAIPAVLLLAAGTTLLSIGFRHASPSQAKAA